MKAAAIFALSIGPWMLVNLIYCAIQLRRRYR